MRYSEHDEDSGNTGSERHTDITLLQAEAQTVWQWAGLQWVGGALFLQDTLDQIQQGTGTVEVDDASRHAGEAYTQSTLKHNDSQYVLGLRVQQDSDFGWHHAMRGSISHSLKAAGADITLRAAAGQSYRVPNLKERYYVFDHSNLGYMVLGNADLVPETAISGNVGLAASWTSAQGNTVEGDIALHYANADDFIATVIDAEASADAGLDISVYQNLAKATLSGLDLALTSRFSHLKLEGNYSYLDAQDGEHNRLAERPRHQLKASLAWQFDHIEADWQIYGVWEWDVAPAAGYSNVYRDHSFTLNTAFQHQLTSNWQWRIGVENLLDEHRDSSAAQTGGFDARPIASRRIYAGIQYRL